MRVLLSVRPKARRLGFTLVEVLVTTVVVGVMAAVVVPALTKHLSSADPARMASDLMSIKSGIQSFSFDVKPRFPGDLEDLVNRPATTGDLAVDGAVYTQDHADAWKGTYIEKQLPAATAGSGSVWEIATVGFFENDVKICSMDATTNGCTPDVTTGSPFVTVQIDSVTENEFTRLNDIIDAGETNGTTESWAKGSLRYTSSTFKAFFLAVPYVAP